MSESIDQKLEIEWRVCSSDEFSVNADEWDALNACTADLPILDAAFYRESLAQFGDGSERLVMGRVDGELVAAGILTRERQGIWSTYQPSQAPLGAWLIRPDFDMAHTCGSLQRALPGFCVLLGISQQDPRLSCRPDDLGRLRTLDYIDTASIPVNGSFADYWAARGRNLRQNLKRQRNRLDREGRRARLEIIVDADAIGAAVDDYGDLEFCGWKAEKGTAVHRDNAQGRFYRNVLEHLAAKGEATIYRYWYNGELAASDLCVHRNGVFIILKTAHNEKFGKTSPTHLMRQEYLESLFRDGSVRRIEFYGKLMNWHTKWSDDVRRMYHVNLFRWAVLPWFARLRGGS